MSSRFEDIASVGILFFIASYAAFLYGSSILASEWVTDRMLHNEFNYFEVIIMSHAPNLHESIKFLNQLADETSVFNVFGIIISLSGLAGLIMSLFLAKIERSRENLVNINWEKMLPSSNSLTIIFSTLFAVSLIFITIADQAKSDTEQTIVTSILLTNTNQTANNILKVTINEVIEKNSYDYFVNIRHAVFIAQLSVSFLILALIRYTKTHFAFILNNYLLSAFLFAFCAWIIITILDIGVTNPPSQPDINLPKLWSWQSFSY